VVVADLGKHNVDSVQYSTQPFDLGSR